MKAHDASDILDSKLWKDAVSSCKGELIARFERAEPDDIEVLRTIRHRLKALQEIVAALERELKLPSINLK